MMRALYFVVAMCVLSHSATAAIIVSYVGSNITAGGFGTVDVMVSSNASSGTPDNLAFVAAHFRIAPIGSSPAGGLQFVDPQGDSQLTDPNYVFFGNSSGTSPLGVVSSFANPNDDYAGGDGTPLGVEIPLHSGLSPYLLFRFNLDATLSNVGDQYELKLLNDGGTDFWDDATNSLAFSPVSYAPFTLTAVPEPSTFALMALGSAFYYFRRRQPSNASHLV